MSAVATIAAGTLLLWLLAEVALRVFLEWPLRTDFYGSIPRARVRTAQERHGVRVASGPGWCHLGWIADPHAERYRVCRRDGERWLAVGEVVFGSHLVRQAGTYQVWAEPRDGTPPRCLGTVEARPADGTAPLHVPVVGGPWQSLFRPRCHGSYVNDHHLYRDGAGHWRLVGITGPGDGNYAEERRFAVAVSADFPPPHGMEEAAPVADFGELAWAPFVVAGDGLYHLFWSPHRLHRMTSRDGIAWSDHRIVMDAPVHKFFRDAMIFEVAPGQWLLYATARRAYFSCVDVYQSFDLEGWQYIGSALRTGLGSERNAAFASTESPTVLEYAGRYYLAVTYNNDSFVWSAAMLALRRWRGRESYNDTLVFHADNPYDFGCYRGRRRSPSLLTTLRAHAPEFVLVDQRWYVTTAGWPWAATLTAGEVGVAPLRWEPTRRT